MLDGLFLVSLVGAAVQMIKEANQPIIPAENWANKELYYKDMMNDVSDEQLKKNLVSGRYKLNTKVERHPEPHRDPVSGKIVIENCKLYREDVKAYGAVQAQKWVREGKYNLDAEGLRKEKERIEAHYARLYRLAGV